MIKVVRVLLLVCLVHPMVQGISVAAVQSRGATRTRQTIAKRAASKRVLRPRVRALRPRRMRRAILRRPGRRVGDLSTSGLTVAGSSGIGAVQPALAAVSGVAGVTLAASSALELSRARNHIERADAAHGIAWGLQSVGGVGSMWWHAPGWFEPMAFGLGLGGGGIQTAVGLYRLKTGLATRDRRTIILGVLDTGAGASWIASTVTGNPITLAAFFGLTGARLLYSNAPRLKSLAKRAARGVSRLFDRATSRIDRFIDERPHLARNWR